MEIYLDTANQREIEWISKYKFLDGVTTNPSIISKEEGSFKDIIQNIDRQVDGKVWMQVTEQDAEDMVDQGLEMSRWVSKPVIKLPMNEQGLAAAHRLRGENIEVNMTLIYTLAQVVLAAKADVNYISPYIGRMDDHLVNGQEFIQKAKQIIEALGANTKIIGASIRTPQVVVDLALNGYDAVTMSFPIFQKLFASQLTDQGLSQFMDDWNSFSKQ